MTDNNNSAAATGLMSQQEFDSAIKNINMTDNIKGACRLILVKAYYRTVACKQQNISRPTANKYLKLIKDQWRKDIANS